MAAILEPDGHLKTDRAKANVRVAFQTNYRPIVVDRMWGAAGLFLLGAGTYAWGKRDLGVVFMLAGPVCVGVQLLIAVSLYSAIGIRSFEARSNTLSVTGSRGRVLRCSRRDLRRVWWMGPFLGLGFIRISTLSQVIWFADEGISTRDRDILRRLLKPVYSREWAV